MTFSLSIINILNNNFYLYFLYIAAVDLTERQLWAAAAYSRFRMLPPPQYLNQLYNEQLLIQAREQTSRHEHDDVIIEKSHAMRRKRKSATPMKTGIKRPWEDGNSDGRPSSPINDDHPGK